MNIDKLIDAVQETKVEENVGAVLHHYYAGQAIGALGWRTATPEQLAAYAANVKGDLTYIFGSDMADKINKLY